MHEKHHHTPSSSSRTKEKYYPTVFLLLLGLRSTCSICLPFSVVVFSPRRKQQPYWVARAHRPSQKSQSVFNELCVCGSQPEAFHSWPVGISFSPLSSAYLLPLCFSLLIILSFRLIRNGAESRLLMFSKAFIYHQAFYLPFSFIPGEERGQNKLHQSTDTKTSVIFCIINPYFTFVASHRSNKQFPPVVWSCADSTSSSGTTICVYVKQEEEGAPSFTWCAAYGYFTPVEPRGSSLID